MRRRLVILGIVGFWVVMMGTLVRRWILEIHPQFVPGTYQSVLTAERRDYHERMGIYWRGQRIGYTETFFVFRTDGSRCIDNVTRVRWPGSPLIPAELVPREFVLTTSAVIVGDGQDMALERLVIRLETDGVVAATCTGQVDGETLVLRPTIGGEKAKPIECPMPRGGVVSQGLSPLLALPRLRTGMHWSATVVDPFTRAPSEVEMRVVRREQIELAGETRDTHVVEIESGMWMRATAWVSPQGEVLKQELPILGLTLVKELPPEGGPGSPARERRPGLRPHLLPGTYQAVLTPERRSYRERLGIFLAGKRVGYSETHVASRGDGSGRIETVTRVTWPESVPVPRGLTGREFELRTSAHVVGEGRGKSLRRLVMRLEADGAVAAACVGEVRGTTLVLRRTLDGKEMEPVEWPLPKGRIVSQGLSPLLPLPPLQEGTRWSATVVDPFALAASKARMRVLRRERIEVAGRVVEAHVVEAESGMWMGGTAWVSPQGEVLKQELPALGLTLVKEPLAEERPARQDDPPETTR